MNKTDKLYVYLLRHGKPDYPHNGMIYYGATDYPLSAEGRLQAMRVHKDLLGINFDALFSSPMTRCRQTTEIVFPGSEAYVKLVDDFREISFGSWEGKTFDEVRDEWDSVYEVPGRDFAHSAPPGGETLCEVQERAVAALEKILSRYKSGRILISAHNGVMYSIISRYFKLPLEDCFSFNADYCGLHIFTVSEGYFKLLRFNWNSELENRSLGGNIE